MSKRSDEAAAMFLEGNNCAQSVLACCGADLGLPREVAVRIGQAFGGGIGKTGNLCGALTGALMVVGLKKPAIVPTDAAGKANACDQAQAILAEFARRNGSLLCRDLIGCDLRTPEGQRHFKESGAHQKICVKLVQGAAEIVEQLLQEKENA